eukprot:TRINITY_DN10161_c0_g1_i1.p1 TRINITY_DN10161_c0_g1~~TRINITY_DN10161_c0_g1_i1.p1  ORF type:complete len:1243 (-),score=235.43 TRINITY_DN10161_c0_g1_i1:53-3733(-)
MTALQWPLPALLTCIAVAAADVSGKQATSVKTCGMAALQRHAALSSLTETVKQLPDFEPVNGGVGQACRGRHDADNRASYYTLLTGLGSLEMCQERCTSTPNCRGVEYNDASGRCEVWTEGIGATRAVSGFYCSRYTQFNNVTSGASDIFQPVDGGVGRACRGQNPEDNRKSYYRKLTGMTLEGCKQECMQEELCQGIEYGQNGRCEVWIRAEGIQATAVSKKYGCWRYTQAKPKPNQPGSFEMADGGLDRACRGGNSRDNKARYYTKLLGVSLDACKAQCVIEPTCKGIEYREANQRCEVWTRPDGIEATAAVRGYTCLTYVRSIPRTTSSTIAPTTSTTIPSTTPITTTSATRASTTATTYCDEGAWPDKDHGLVCGECKVLVNRFSSLYKTCNGYCQAIGRMCTGAWDEVSDTCSVARGMTCDQTLDSSDAICECAVEMSVTSSSKAPPTTSAEPCHTAEPGDACHDAVTWAMQSGIFEHPEWYPGLSASSSFADFQAHLHEIETDDGACQPPCTGQPLPPTPVPTPLPTHPSSSSCQAVLDAVAADDWSSDTCSGRIAWYQSAAGGALTKQEAQAQAALYYTACEPCWPWPKYKVSGDQSVSSKRGIAIANDKLSVSALASLQQAISWGYIWHFNPSTVWGGGPSLSQWDAFGIHFVPMIWGEKQMRPAQTEGLPAGRKALMGFNEPNFPDQANLSPTQAASMWPQVEKLAKDAGIEYLVSPAVNFAAIDPIDWLQEFLDACNGCKVDAIAFHSYTCYGRWLKDHMQKYKKFRKPLWLTEFACSERGSLERRDAAGQAAFMKEAIPMLEQDPDIEMYAWFSYFEDEWGWSLTDGKNGDAGLVTAKGDLSELGQLYSSFASALPAKSSPTKPVTEVVTTATGTTTSERASNGASAIGVNVFGADGFKDDASLRAAVRSSLRNGIRHFRVVNVGAWQDAILEAIDDEALGLGDEAGTVSIQITSLFFDSPSTCDSLPSWMDYSLQTTSSKLSRLRNVGRILVQLDTCSICQGSDLYCINPTEQAMQGRRAFVEDEGPSGYGVGHLRKAHEALPSKVEFVIPYMSASASPDDLVQGLVRRHVAPLRREGRRFHIEGTFYPFWTSSEQVYAPFPVQLVSGFVEKAAQLGFDGFVVAETGWPRSCPKAPARSTRPATLENMCKYFSSVLEDAAALARSSPAGSGAELLVYHWKFGPADDGSCGAADTWGLFQSDGSFVCRDALPAWS